MNKNIISAIMAGLVVLLIEMSGILDGVVHKPIVLALSVGAVVFIISLFLREKKE